MTEPEGSDNLGNLFGGLASSQETTAAPAAYPTRRSLRAAELTSSASSAASEPAENAAPTVPPAAEKAAPVVPVMSFRRQTARHPIRARVTAAGTMVIIGGLFAALGLPAYAEGDDTADVAIADAEAVQSFEVSEVASATAIERDSYDATSAAELVAQYRSSLADTNLAIYLRSGAAEAGDDYPWPAALHLGQGGGLSPLRYYYRECVDFVAWRLNRDQGSYSAPFKWDWSSMTPGGGSAISWKYQWEAHGWEISSTPQPGWVAWFGGGNHVAYVKTVNGDGTILVEEYNWGGTHMYGQRTIPASSVTAFLAPPS